MLNYISNYLLDISPLMAHKPLKLNTPKCNLSFFSCQARGIPKQEQQKPCSPSGVLALSEWQDRSSLLKSETWESPLTPQSFLATTCNLSASPFRSTSKQSASSTRLCAHQGKEPCWSFHSQVLRTYESASYIVSTEYFWINELIENVITLIKEEVVKGSRTELASTKSKA